MKKELTELLYAVIYNKESYRHSSRREKQSIWIFFQVHLLIHFKMEMDILPHHKCSYTKVIFYISKLMFTRSNMIFYLFTAASIIVNILRILLTDLPHYKTYNLGITNGRKGRICNILSIHLLQKM